MKMRRQFPVHGGRGVPTVPVPIPFVAAAAMLGAFALGRATESARKGEQPLPCGIPELRRTTARSRGLRPSP